MGLVFKKRSVATFIYFILKMNGGKFVKQSLIHPHLLLERFGLYMTATSNDVV